MPSLWDRVVRRLAKAALVLVAAAAAAAAGEPAAGRPPVTVELFFSPGCRECERVREDLLPAATLAFEGRVVWREADLGIVSNYLRLSVCLRAAGNPGRASVFLLVDGRQLLSGYAEIEARLFPAIETALGSSPGGQPPGGAAPANLAEPAGTFTPWAVLAGGLVDGINPCAISTLVFFISLLAVAGVRGRALWLAGGLFCLASLAVYFAIGFGLLRALHLLDGFGALRAGLNRLMAAVLFLLALLSFRDARRFAASRKPAAVALRLPDALRNRLHRYMGTAVRTRRVAAAALACGAVVTVIESVCTGQVYLPTLVYLVRSGHSVPRNSLLLLLYNTAFILPLAAVLVLACLGIQAGALVRWSTRHVTAGKLLLGLFFLGLAILFMMV